MSQDRIEEWLKDIKSELVKVNSKIDLISTISSETGESEIRVFQENYLIANNSTTVILGANETYTGGWQDCLNYQEINVSIVASHNSALNGLIFQWSADGVIIGDTDVFSYYSASGGTNYTPNPAFRYFRILYTNGATPQTSFSLQAILRRGVTGGSFHRIDSTLKDDQDGRLVVAVPKLRTSANNWVSQQATSGGNAKMSLEELESGISTNNKTQLRNSIHDATSGLSPKIEARVQTPTGNAMNVQIGPGDVISNIPVFMPYDHHQLHEGETFRWSVFVSSLASGVSKYIRLVVPDITIPVGMSPVIYCPHIRIEALSDSFGQVFLYEGATFSANGTQRTPIALERNGTYTPKLQIWEGPSITLTGTQIWQGVNFSSKTSAGSIDQATNEFVLKNNTSYLIQYLSSTAGLKLLLRFEWYDDLGV
jgi:hypothetical protein